MDAKTKMNALQFATANIFGLVADGDTDTLTIIIALRAGWIVPCGRGVYELTASGLTEAITRGYEIGVIVGIVKEIAA